MLTLLLIEGSKSYDIDLTKIVKSFGLVEKFLRATTDFLYLFMVKYK